MKTKKSIRIIICSLFAIISFGNLLHGDQHCPCDDGTSPYKVDCSGDGVNDACEESECCNEDAGDPEFLTKKIDMKKEMSIGPYEIELPEGCGTLSIPQIVEVKVEVKGEAEGFADPLEIPIAMTASGQAINFVTYTVGGDGSANRYAYVPCVGPGCYGPIEGGTPNWDAVFTVSFTVSLCTLVNWTSPAIPFFQWSEDLDPVEYEICLPGGSNQA